MMVILALFAGVGAGFGPEPLPTNVGVAWVNCWAVFSVLGIKLRMSQSINPFCFAACRIKSRRGCPPGYLIFFPLDQRFAPGAMNFWVGAAHPGGLIFMDKIVGCGFCIRWFDFFFCFAALGNKIAAWVSPDDLIFSTGSNICCQGNEIFFGGGCLPGCVNFSALGIKLRDGACVPGRPIFLHCCPVQ